MEARNATEKCGCNSKSHGELMGIRHHQFQVCEKHGAFRYFGFGKASGFNPEAFITTIRGMRPLTEQDAWHLVAALQMPDSDQALHLPPGGLVKESPDDVF